MKKLCWIILVSLLLCGCSQENTASPEEDMILCVNPSGDVCYQTIPEFLDSEYCQTMQDEGNTIYLPVWDAEKYTLCYVMASREEYRFVLEESETGNAVSCCIDWKSEEQGVYEISDKPFDNDNGGITTAEKNGVEYDVYVSPGNSANSSSYSIQYIPYDHCFVSIETKNNSPQEILDDFKDFDIVPVSEWDAG